MITQQLIDGAFYTGKAAEPCAIGMPVCHISMEQSTRPCDVPCPLCLGQMVVQLAAVGRAAAPSWPAPNGVGHVVVYDRMTDGMRCLWCEECGVGFYERQQA